MPGPHTNAARSTTAVRFPPELHDRLRETAETYGWTANWIVVRAVTEFLDNLLPPDQLVFTRRNGEDT